MSALNTFELKPLSAMMKIPTVTFCLFAALQGQAQAVQVGNGEQRTIDDTTQSTDWQLSGQSTLNMNRATATDIGLTTSTLNMNSGSVANSIRAERGSTVNINSAQVSSSDPILGAVRLESSNAFINDSTITNSRGVALQAFGVLGTSNGSSVQVANSTISGAIGGAEASSGSELHFERGTVVQGTGYRGIRASTVRGHGDSQPKHHPRRRSWGIVHPRSCRYNRWQTGSGQLHGRGSYWFRLSPSGVRQTEFRW